MHRASRRLAALLAVAALAAPAAAAQAAGPPLVGINIPGLNGGSTPAEADHSIALARKLHAKIVRADFPWSVLEPTGPVLNAQALAFTDRLVADAAAAGIKVSATVASTPCWVSSAPAPLLSKCVPGRSSAANSWPPSDPPAYGALLAALAQRYGSRLAAIEVWNEPDQSNEDYFAGPNKAANYAKLLRAAYPAVKQADPTLPVLAGSMVGSNGLFLRALYAAGIKGFYDGLSVHYYHLTLGSLRAIREVQLANHDTKPLWLDEFGWTSCWPARQIEQEQPCVTAGAQALNLRNAIREMSRAPYLAAAIVYKLSDSPAENFGALTTQGTAKPSFTGLREAFERPYGPFSPITLHLQRHGSHVVASGSGPVADYMGIEAFQGTVLRYRALFTLDRFNRYSIAMPAALGTHGLRVRVFQYWAGTGRAATRSI
ncbi:MAG: glycosyl hydrolase [Solirubrobacteraceae bacterium]